MPYITAGKENGTNIDIYYKDWGSGRGHDMDHYADDLKAVTDHLNLKDAIHVGHSTGGQVVHDGRNNPHRSRKIAT